MPNLIYQATETEITFKSSGGSADFTPTSLASGSGHQGAHYDLTTSDRSTKYAWRAYCKFATPANVGEVVRLYLKTSDGTYPDNDDGTGDIAVSAENKLRNLMFIGNIIVDENSTSPTFVASSNEPIQLPHRYVAPVFWNATSDALSSTASDHGFILIPVPDEIQ